MPTSTAKTEPIAEHARKRPMHRGDHVVSAEGKRYRVIRVSKEPCAECGGTGRKWRVRLKGELKKFETTLRHIAGSRYTLERKA